MATSRTFEILWGKFENEQTAFESLKSKSQNSDIPAEKKSERLNIIKKNLEDIIVRAQNELRDPWEEDMMIKSADVLLKEVILFF